MNKIRVSVVGGLGRMGKENIAAILQDSELDLVAALLKKDDPSLQNDLSNFFSLPKKKLYFTYSIEKALEISDIVVDFTSPDVTKKLLEYNKIYKRGLVIGTTNLSFIDQLPSYATQYSILYSPNFSLGMNLFFQILKIVSQTLHKKLDYDVELIESHHRFKKDSPSGTAIELLKIVSENSGRKFPDCISYQKDKNYLKNLEHIGVSSLREGSVFGYHEIRFTDLNENFTISHQVYDRKLFSKGVILGIKFLLNKKKGLYSMLDVLDFLKD